MLSLLQRSVSTVHDRLVVLAPPQATIPSFFGNVVVDASRHGSLLEDLQRLRGRIYLDDGAIREDELTEDGRHETSDDDRSWHLLILDRQGEAAACTRYLNHPRTVAVDDLHVSGCALARHPEWRSPLMEALSSELESARQQRFRLAEIGGWAVTEESRGTPDGLLLAFGAFGLGRMFGGSLGLATATVRHGSSGILRRLGGRPLQTKGVTLPSYYDPQYDCEMDIVKFDSGHPHPRYAELIDQLAREMMSVPVVAPAVGLRAVQRDRRLVAA